MLADFFDALATWMEHIVHVLGLPGITLIALLENLFPPTPSEFLYPLAGKLAYDGKIIIWGVIVAGVIGSLIGSLIYYSLGYWLGEARVRQVIARYGQIKLWRLQLQVISVEEYDRAIELFQRWGGILVFVARLMPLVHGVVSIPAGVTRMKLVPFVFYTALGSALWIAPLTLIGLWLGDNWERILYWLDVYQTGWYSLLGLLAVYWVIKRVRAHYRQKNA